MTKKTPPSDPKSPEFHDDEDHTEESLRGTIVKGSIWMVGMRWSIRGIGLLSTLILVRLLTPDDFGVVAMAMLVIGFFEVFQENGIGRALIRQEKITEDHYHTAWTLQVIFNFCIFIFIIGTSFFVHYFFEETRIIPVIQVLAFRIFILGFENTKIYELQKNFKFAVDFRYNLYKKVILAVITVALAFYLKTYWALVIGMTLSPLIQVILSFSMFRQMPKINLSKSADLLGYSIWTMVMSIGRMLDTKIDLYAVGYLFNTTSMGVYTVINEVAIQPIVEMISPLSRVLFPVFTKIKHSQAELRKSFLNVLSVIGVIVIGAGVGIALVAENLIFVLLGEKWGAPENTLVMIYLSLSGVILLIANTVPTFLSAIGSVKKVSSRIWFRLFLFIALVFAGSTFLQNPYHIAIIRLMSLIIVLPIYFYDLRGYIRLRLSDLVQMYWRPIIGALVMAISVKSLPALSLKMIELAMQCSVGAFTYISVLLVLWLIAGKPSGPENAAVKFLQKKIKSRLV